MTHKRSLRSHQMSHWYCRPSLTASVAADLLTDQPWITLVLREAAAQCACSSSDVRRFSWIFLEHTHTSPQTKYRGALSTSRVLGIRVTRANLLTSSSRPPRNHVHISLYVVTAYLLHRSRNLVLRQLYEQDMYAFLRCNLGKENVKTYACLQVRK